MKKRKGGGASILLNLPVMFAVNCVAVAGGVCVYALFQGGDSAPCEPIASHQISNKNQVGVFWLLTVLSRHAPGLAGLALASLLFAGVLTHAANLLACRRLLLTELLLPSISKTGKTLLVEVTSTILLGSLTIGLSILYTLSTNTILNLFFLFSNSLNSIILGAFALAILNPFSNRFVSLFFFYFLIMPDNNF
jgi:hypothetical protein